VNFTALKNYEVKPPFLPRVKFEDDVLFLNNLLNALKG